MEVVKINQGELVARGQEKVNEWYLIQEGTVSQRFQTAEVVLEKNAMIGLLDSDWFLCDYVAKTDTTLISIPCNDAVGLRKMLSENRNYRSIFLKTAIEQRHKMLCLYVDLQNKARQYHAFVESIYHDYKNICSQLLIEEQPFTKMDGFEPLQMQHRVENWEILNSNSLVKNYLKDYLLLMQKDDSLCVAAIMETAAQQKRITRGIWEMVKWLDLRKEVLVSTSEDDIFHLFFDLGVRLAKQNKDVTSIQKDMGNIIAVAQKLGVYSDDVIKNCLRIYENYDFENVSVGKMNVLAEDCPAHIMKFAGYDDDKIRESKEILNDFKNLPDPTSTEKEAYAVRKRVTPMFYDIYEKVFFNVVKKVEKPTPIIMMFLHFAFMDVELLGEEYTNSLYHLTDHMSVFQSDHTFTIYDWLKKIYRGEKEPSKNEFDLDYQANLLDMRKRGELTAAQVDALKNNQEEKVKFEMQNLFRSGHKLTYGKITTFCPIIANYDVINSIERMAVTVERIDEALNKIREVDYSVLYREILFSDPERDINHEQIQKEVIPDFILMPDAGTKAVMWQELGGVKKDTPARFLFPLFTAVDLDEMMIETMGRYRWEICRRVQGVYWNDIREKSLTSEYCDYIQFYRKNSELSQDAKEKIKTALTRARNNYREVFVKDYQNWIKFEAKGGFRLNKVARNILVKYCLFSKEIRADLVSSPMYQNVIPKLEAENNKKAQKFMMLYDKYQKAGGEITPELRENLRFYQM